MGTQRGARRGGVRAAGRTGGVGSAGRTGSVPAPQPGKMAAKVPQIMQMEALECGAACLAMVCAYWGKWLPLEQVRRDCGVSRDGSNALSIVKAARAYGFTARGYRYEPEAMREKATFPCIVHWNFNHFVVVRGFARDSVLINDPARGEVRVSLHEFDEAFTGICLEFAPSDAFEPGGAPASIRAFVMERLQGAVPLVAFLAMVLAVSQAIDAVNPLFTQVLTDRLLGGGHPSWVVPFVQVMGAVGVIQVFVLGVAAYFRAKIMGKLAVVSSAGFFWHVLHLPVEFFSQRSPGDIAARVDANATVAHQLVGTLAPLAINFVMLVLYLTLMVGYSPVLAAVGVASVVLNLALAVLVSRRRVNIMRVRQRDEANYGAATVTGIDMIETIKAAGAEDGYFERWSGFQAGASRQSASAVELDARLGALPQAVSGATDALILVLGALLVINGSFSAGMLLAFQGFLSRFGAPAEALIASIQTIFEMRTDMERIQDVMTYPEDPLASDAEGTAPLSGATAIDSVPVADGGTGADSAFGAGLAAQASVGASQDADAAVTGATSVSEAAPSDDPLALADALMAQLDSAADSGYEKLRGEVQIENVSFGYSPLADPLIKDFSLHIKPGKSVALVGPSGCGKSTIAKLVSGLYAPWEGSVLLDGKPLSEIPRAVRTGSIAVVEQDVVLFEDTVDANIRLWDESIENYEVILAARDAEVHDDIMARPGAYQMQLFDGGRNLSGGQRQRLEIARALAADPTILILDEATSALDAVTERRVMERIRRRGITLIVIAHRLSTVRDCDEILVLEHGAAVERGTHDELWEAGGLYARLVTVE